MTSIKARIRKIQGFIQWTENYIHLHKQDKQYSRCSYYITFFWAYMIRRIGLDELGYYRYMDRTSKERKQIVPRRENLKFIRKVNNVTDTSVLSDKMKCYNYFRKYYKRDVMAVSADKVASEETIKDFIEFVHHHGVVIVKPLAECEGKGVQSIDEHTYSDSLLKEIIIGYKGGYMAEECVHQHPFMSAVHPQSVNTIRINTVKYDDEVEVYWPSWRVGQGDAVVDNYSAGGISIPIDKETGKTICAISKDGNRFTHHPDTGLSLVDVQIPKWDELCDIVKEMAMALTDMAFVGWDMALTPEGWVVIEANYEPDNKAWQMTSSRGIRADFEEMKRRLDVR